MKAIVIERFGGVNELNMKEIDKPELKPDRLLVEVFATSVNPVDTKRRSGSFGGKLPMIVGNDVAGKVMEVGEEVTGFEVGDRVMANGSKTYAEIVSVRPDRTVKLDDSVSFEEAAAVPLTGQTAYEALVRRGDIKSGEKVLIHAGSGGVGSLAVQIAKIKGAWVAATASGSNQELLESLGADRPVNYEKEDFETALEDIDLVLDTLGGKVLEKSLSLIDKQGRLLSIAGDPSEYVDTEDYDATSFSMKPTQAALSQLHEWLAEGKLEPVIADVLPFTEAAVRKAHEKSETGHVRGKLIIKMKE
ncbi:NADPH:quinone reductase [Alkalibacterium subtropicum]|uniref:NADPH:quinone reductase n=1 Tax=Alkalibacterium subtropicum TaxID=753702 RepID=A0A1I1KEH5_9LACT|nr:NADP-dependent oxidoreductase [Alkalibacterium subtropicum]SFC59031.1 NADPH:quinone reductase [Alkalibacterium subtropicum]